MNAWIKLRSHKKKKQAGEYRHANRWIIVYSNSMLRSGKKFHFILNICFLLIRIVFAKDKPCWFGHRFEYVHFDWICDCVTCARRCTRNRNYLLIKLFRHDSTAKWTDRWTVHFRLCFCYAAETTMSSDTHTHKQKNRWIFPRAMMDGWYAVFFCRKSNEFSYLV